VDAAQGLLHGVAQALGAGDSAGELIAGLKVYLESGKFSRGKTEATAETGFVMLGNISLDASRSPSVCRRTRTPPSNGTAGVPRRCATAHRLARLGRVWRRPLCGR
jgi:hypothetical protein